MLKSLIAVGLASILITQPPQNTNDGTYYQDVEITESYEYETNEVNNVDDLVVGNIYHMSITQDINFSSNINAQAMYNLTGVGGESTVKYYNIKLSLIDEGTTYLRIGYYNPNRTLYLNDENANNYLYLSLNDYDTIELDFVYLGNANSQDIVLISASDYLGEKTITIEPVETEGLYNLAYHFLYSRIYTNTELQGMETTLFGTTINMNMWLSHTTAIIIICLLLIVLIKFVLWLFKIVSGGMLWK